MTYVTTNTYEAETEDGSTETRTGTTLHLKNKAGAPQLEVGETVVITMRGDPASAREFTNKYSNSRLFFMTLEDGTDVSCFIQSNKNGRGGWRSSVFGVNVDEALATLQAGDTVSITRIQKEVQGGEFAGRVIDVFKVEPVSVAGGVIPAFQAAATA